VSGFKEGECPSCHHAQHVGQACLVCNCPAEAAIKADHGKPFGFRLLAWDAVLEVLEVYHYGIKKGYLAESWRTVSPERYLNAMVRHLIALLRNDKIDQESGLRHAAHLAWNALAYVALTQGEWKGWTWQASDKG